MAGDQPYVSGQWLVRQGSEDEFVKRWTEFTQWARDNAPGAQGFMLLRDNDDPRRFVSLGRWDDTASIKAWRSDAGFMERLARARELCDEFEARDYTVAVTI